MNENLHHNPIDDLFNKALEEGQEPPPGHVWEGIERSLDVKKPVVIRDAYNRVKHIAAVLLLLFAGISIYALSILLTPKKLAGTKEAKNSKTAVGTPAGWGTKHNDKNRVEETPVSKENQKEKIISKTRQEEDRTPVKEGSVPVETPAIPSVAAEGNVKIPVRPHPIPAGLPSALAGIVKKENTESPNTESTIDISSSPVSKKVQQDSSALSKIIINPVTANEYQRAATEPVALEPLAKTNALPYIDLKAISLPVVAPVIISNPFKPALSLKLYISPELDLETDGNASMPRRRERSEYRKQEKYTSSVSAGVLINYGFVQNWSLESGISYAASTIGIAPKTIYARHDNFGNIRYQYNCSSGYAYIDPKGSQPPAIGDSITALASKNTLQYLSVPVKLKYNYAIGKVVISAAAGMSVNFLTRGTNETLLQNNTSKENTVNGINGLKSNYFSALVGVGVEYRVTKRWSFSLSPTARMAVTSINKNTPVDSYPKSLGLEAGFHFAL